jgi:deazaflavin-dependent oxidoreductase (nitroreductase family)
VSSSETKPNFNGFNQALIADLRANGGKASSGPFLGRPLLVLGTTGAHSGEKRETPLVYSEDGENRYVIASKGGAPTHPSWYHNLVAHPEVELEVLGERYPARARVTKGEERDRLYAKQADRMPAFHDYEKKTDRKIPVVVFERVG